MDSSLTSGLLDTQEVQQNNSSLTLSRQLLSHNYGVWLSSYVVLLVLADLPNVVHLSNLLFSLVTGSIKTEHREMKKLVLHYQRQQADDEPKGGDIMHSTLTTC